MWERTALRLMLLLGALTFPVCVDPLPTAELQTLLCSPGCKSHSQSGERHLPFLRFAKRSFIQPLASLAITMRPLPSSLLGYLAALRGMRGGATAAAMPPSEFSHFGLSDLGQTSTAAPEIEPRAALRSLSQPLSSTRGADFHKLNLVELQRELRLRGLSTRGLKHDLVDRLQEHIADAPAGQKPAEDAATGKRHRKSDDLDNTSQRQSKNAKKKRLRLPTGRSRASGAGLDLLQQVTTAQDADLVFEVFPTQAEAFQFADARPGLGLQVYSQDKWSTGAKSYVAATTTGFWSEYKKLAPVERHFGEIIREGSPCRLYFDFEFRIRPEESVSEQFAAGNRSVDELLRNLVTPAAR